MKPAPALLTRADIRRLKINGDSKSVLFFLLDNPPKVYERSELGEEIGLKPSLVEIAIMRLQRRWPFLLKREGPAKEVLRARHGFIAGNDPLRKAWANDGAVPAEQVLAVAESLAEQPPVEEDEESDDGTPEEETTDPGFTKRDVRTGKFVKKEDK